MFPLRDNNPTELTPYITILLIAINVAVWVSVQGAGIEMDTFVGSICRYGTIPAELLGRGDYDGVRLGRGAVCEFGGLAWSTLFTSMFMHGGWFHLLGNMWFLWLFGNNIEDSTGHLRFLSFYLLTGLIASGAHIFSVSNSPMPTVGASGAISGVMGAYLILYPSIRITTYFFPVWIIAVPAWLVLAEWLIIQIFTGVAGPAVGGGVAVWAHVGGFISGLIVVKIFENPELVEAKRHHVKLDPRGIPHRGWW